MTTIDTKTSMRLRESSPFNVSLNPCGGEVVSGGKAIGTIWNEAIA